MSKHRSSISKVRAAKRGWAKRRSAVRLITDWYPFKHGGVVGYTTTSLGRTPIHTSNVVRVHGNTITTKSGSTYRLGRMDPRMKSYLRHVEGIDTSSASNVIKGKKKHR